MMSEYRFIDKNQTFRNHLAYFAGEPHFTGQKRDRDISKAITKWFKHLGLETSVPSYNVLLSFPNFNKNGKTWDTDITNEVDKSTLTIMPYL